MQLYVVYGVAGLGVALGILSLVKVLPTTVNVQVINSQILKLIAAGNVERAIKLCTALPKIPLARLVKGGLEAGLDESAPETRARRMEQHFGHHVDAAFAPFKSGKVIALGAVGLSVAAALIGLALGERTAPPFIMAGVGVLLPIWVIRHIVTARPRSEAAAKQVAASLRKAR